MDVLENIPIITDAANGKIIPEPKFKINKPDTSVTVLREKKMTMHPSK